MSKFGFCLENFHEEKIYSNWQNPMYWKHVKLFSGQPERASGKCFICVSKHWSVGKKTAFRNMLWKINSTAIILFFPSLFFLSLFLLSLPVSLSLSLLKISCHSDCICLQTCQTQWAAQANRIWQNPPNCWAQDVVLWPSARSTWTSSDFYLAVSLRFIWHSNYEC